MLQTLRGVRSLALVSPYQSISRGIQTEIWLETALWDSSSELPSTFDLSITVAMRYTRRILHISDSQYIQMMHGSSIETTSKVAEDALPDPLGAHFKGRCVYSLVLVQICKQLSRVDLFCVESRFAKKLWVTHVGLEVYTACSSIYLRMPSNCVLPVEMRYLIWPISDTSLLRSNSPRANCRISVFVGDLGIS